MSNEQYLIEQTLQGDKKALTLLMEPLQEKVYNLAVRYLWEPADAQDATQEIMIRVITHLSSFQGKSAFGTWVYRIAVNYLLNCKASRQEQRQVSFDDFSQYIKSDLDEHDYHGPDRNVLEQEVKLSCSTGLLLCLNREQRMAYLLGEVFEVDSDTGAEVCETTPENFRKRLSIARDRIRSFMQGHCGIVNPVNACRCNKRISLGLVSGRIAKDNLRFADKGEVLLTLSQVEALHDEAALYKQHPQYKTPEGMRSELARLLMDEQ
ncbi:MAG: RNA polymerase sigma factor [Cyclobacteriaceae bacterium]|nr:RNA polymerase sigma factor [Cyclobacteriaceae bacterium]UYN87262.1 MAG: RNA polymerase sigma factor [Cyclobacteriaceae bacterium]